MSFFILIFFNVFIDIQSIFYLFISFSWSNNQQIFYHKNIKWKVGNTKKD